MAFRLTTVPPGGFVPVAWPLPLTPFSSTQAPGWTLPKPAHGNRLRVERLPGAPADLSLALYQVEIRR